MKQKTALVLGGCGFIGHHLARKLKSQGYWVRVADIKEYEYGEMDYASQFFIGDLRNPLFCSTVLMAPRQSSLDDKENSFDEVYQLAADMGGAGFVFTGENDADIIHNSMLININVANYAAQCNVKKLFFASSACIYPQEIQEKTNNSGLKETDAYPAHPDSDYGFEKLMSERLYDSYRRNKGLDIRVGRFHNIFGPEGTYKGGREKAPAAMCRKVAESISTVEVWGDGLQTRSFLYVDECVEAVQRLMASDVYEPINIGSDEMVSINGLAGMVIQISRKELSVTHINGPQGVRGRNSNNDLIELHLGWKPSAKLYDGLIETYNWINKQINE